MPDPQLPSLSILADQVASERETMREHAESLDAKAGVVLGFAGILVGLGATAQSDISHDVAFRIGLCAGVLAALLAAWAVVPRRYPVLEALRLRNMYLTAAEAETRLDLLDTQIDMIEQTAVLLKSKGYRLSAAVACLAAAAALIVIGTLVAGGPADARRPTQPRTCHHQACATSRATARPAALSAEKGTYRVYREEPKGV
jgi:hypothetical protein